MKRITRIPVLRTLLGLALVIVSGTPSPASITPASQAHAPAAARRARVRYPLPGEFNVLVIVLDDLGTDHLQMYADDGGAPVYCSAAQTTETKTPNLDQLRADGIMFTRCYVNPSCSPSRASMITGRHGRRTGMGHHINEGESPNGYKLPLSEVCLPELIRDQNSFPYKRGAFGKWHMTDYVVDDCHAGDCGYERFEGNPGNNLSHYEHRLVTTTGGGAGCISTSSIDLPLAPATPAEDFWDAGVTRANAANWINSLASTDRFFAYVAFNPPHEPFEVPPYVTVSPRMQGRLSFLGLDAGELKRSGHPEDERLIYRAMVEGVDWEVGQLIASIPPAVLARTMIIVMGDNGTPGPMIKDSALAAHGKRTLFELGTRVPLIVAGPIVQAQGSTCRELVSGVDLWRTVANLTGLDNPTIDAAMVSIPLDSVSFLPLISNPTLPGNRSYAYSETFKNQPPVPTNFGYRRGITNGTYRYMRIYLDDGFLIERLYNTSIDTCEQTDLLSPPHVLTVPEAAAYSDLSLAMNAI